MLRKIRLFTIIVFCVILYADILTVAVRPVKEYSDMENRRLAAKPEFSLKRFFNGKYQKKYEKYLGDQFAARDKWVDISGRFQVLSGKKDVNGVYIGKDGYLIDGADEIDYDKEQADENVTYLSTFLNDASDMYGKENVSCLIIPQKIEVLSDKLPEFAAVPEYNGIIKKLKDKETFRSIRNDVKEYLKTQNNEEVNIFKSDNGKYYAIHSRLHYIGELETLIGEKQFQSFLNPASKTESLEKIMEEFLFDMMKSSTTAKDPTEDELKKKRKNKKRS